MCSLLAHAFSWRKRAAVVGGYGSLPRASRLLWSNLRGSSPIHHLLWRIAFFLIPILAAVPLVCLAEDADGTQSVSGTSEGLEIKASADKRKAAVGDEIAVTVVARSRPRPDKRYDVLSARFPNATNLELIGSSSSGTSIADEKGPVKERILRYTFQATKEGKAETGDIQVEYAVVGGAERQGSGTSAGSSDAADGKGGADDGFLTRTLPSIEIEITGGGLGAAGVLIITAIVVVVAVGAGVCLKVTAKRRRNREAACAEDASDRDLEGDFLQRLDGIRELRISGEIQSYCARVVDVLCAYLNEKFEIDVSANPGELDAAKGQIGADLVGRIKEILHTSEQIRFAGYEPSSHELDRIPDTVREILNKNRPAKDEVKPEDEIELRADADH